MLLFHKTRRTYYHRAHVPKKLRHLLAGRSEVWRSLDTADKDEAKLRSATWESRFLGLYRELRRNGETMTQEDREALVGRWLECKLDEAEDWRAMSGPYSENDLDTKSEILSGLMEDTWEQFLACNYSQIEKEAVDLLHVAGVTNVDRESAEFGRMCRRLLQAKMDYLQIEQQRWNGKYDTTAQRRLAPSAGASANHVATPSATPVAKPVAVPVASGPKFSEIVDRYFKENPRAARSADQAKIEFGKFITLIGGDCAVNTITKEHGRAYKTDLMDGRKLALLTVGKHLATLSGEPGIHH
jgi:hypothetical protein